MGSAKVLNRQRVKARLARIPKAIKDHVGRQLDAEVEDLVPALKRAAPVDDASDNPGELRDSIAALRDRQRGLSYKILADAKDPQGRFIGRDVEFGHRAKDGTHVPAQPFWFVTFRARRKGMSRRLKAAARRGIKAVLGG